MRVDVRGILPSSLRAAGLKSGSRWAKRRWKGANPALEEWLKLGEQL
jgi:hypothetical protein